jgi:hypothetical protein
MIAAGYLVFAAVLLLLRGPSAPDLHPGTAGPRED